MAAGSHIGMIWVILDNPRSAIGGLSLVFKFGFSPIYGCGDIVIFIFCCFGLKLPLHVHFGGVLGHISPDMITHRSNPQKDHPCAESRCLSHET